jgi:hypothetical protein
MKMSNVSEKHESYQYQKKNEENISNEKYNDILIVFRK